MGLKGKGTGGLQAGGGDASHAKEGDEGRKQRGWEDEEGEGKGWRGCEGKEGAV